MGRTTDKHSPRRDDQLAHEEEALVRGEDEGRTEPRRGEAPGPEEGGLGQRPEAEEGGANTPTVSEIEGRAALAATFRPSAFPAGRDVLVEEARRGFADDTLVDRLRRAPDRTYETVGDLWSELEEQLRGS